MKHLEVRIRVGDLCRILRARDTILGMVKDLPAADGVKVKVKRGGWVRLSVENTGEIKEFRI